MEAVKTFNGVELSPKEIAMQKERHWAVGLSKSQFKMEYTLRHKGFEKCVDVFPTQEEYLAVVGLAPSIAKSPISAEAIPEGEVPEEPLIEPSVTTAEKKLSDLREAYDNKERTYCISEDCPRNTNPFKNKVGRMSHEKTCEHALRVRSQLENA